MLKSSSSPPLLITYVISLHMMWGAALLGWPEFAMPLALLGGFDDIIDIIGAQATGAVLISFALIAWAGLVVERKIPLNCRLWALLALMPQYAIALFAALASASTIIGGSIFSQSQQAEIEVPRVLLVIGTGPLIISGLLHTWAVLVKLAYLNPATEMAYLYMRLAELQKVKERES